MTRRPEHQAWGVWFVVVALTIAATALAVLATTITLVILRAASAAG